MNLKNNPNCKNCLWKEDCDEMNACEHYSPLDTCEEKWINSDAAIGRRQFNEDWADYTDEYSDKNFKD